MDQPPGLALTNHSLADYGLAAPVPGDRWQGGVRGAGLAWRRVGVTFYDSPGLLIDWLRVPAPQ
jgi:hypothetical protein